MTSISELGADRYDVSHLFTECAREIGSTANRMMVRDRAEPESGSAAVDGGGRRQPLLHCWVDPDSNSHRGKRPPNRDAASPPGGVVPRGVRFPQGEEDARVVCCV